MLITADSLVFSGGAREPLYSVEHDGLEGWFDGAPPRPDTQDKPNAHGAFFSPNWRGGRSFSWWGNIHTDSPAEQQKARVNLAGMCSGTGLYTVSVQLDGVTTSVEAALFKAPESHVVTYGNLATYRVEMFTREERTLRKNRDLQSKDL